MINVITKLPDSERKIGGMAAVAHGERGSNDAGGELSGSINRLGYYLSGGYFGSAGFRPNTGFNSSNSHARLTWELPLLVAQNQMIMSVRKLSFNLSKM